MTASDVDSISEEDFEDFEEDFDEIIRAKWQMDGATTLSEAAQMLRAFANHLEGLEAQGWKLRQPVDSDYGFIYQEAP